MLAPVAGSAMTAGRMHLALDNSVCGETGSGNSQSSATETVALNGAYDLLSISQAGVVLLSRLRVMPKESEVGYAESSPDRL